MEWMSRSTSNWLGDNLMAGKVVKKAPKHGKEEPVTRFLS
jgi:hypothetical protein